jgi:hypothetical protein
MGSKDHESKTHTKMVFAAAAETVILLHQTYELLPEAQFETGRLWVRLFRKRCYRFLRDVWRDLVARGENWAMGSLLWGMVSALTGEYVEATSALERALRLGTLSVQETIVAHEIVWACLVNRGLNGDHVSNVNFHLYQFSELCHSIEPKKSFMVSDAGAGAGAGVADDHEASSTQDVYSVSINFCGFKSTEQATLFALNAFVYSVTVTDGDALEKALEVARSLFEWLWNLNCGYTMVDDAIASLVRLYNKENQTSPRVYKLAAVMLALLEFRRAKFPDAPGLIMDTLVGGEEGAFLQLVSNGCKLPTEIKDLESAWKSEVYATYTRLGRINGGVSPMREHVDEELQTTTPLCLSVDFPVSRDHEALPKC